MKELQSDFDLLMKSLPNYNDKVGEIKMSNEKSFTSTSINW